MGHSIGTVKVINEVEGLRKRAEVVAKRIDPKNQANSFYLILLSAALHDIGKGSEKYQQSVKLENGECKASFYMHEVISSSIIFAALEEMNEKEVRELFNSENYHEKASILVYCPLLHHYSMERIEEFLNRSLSISNYSGPIVKGLTDAIEVILNGGGFMSKPNVKPLSDKIISIVKGLEGNREKLEEKVRNLKHKFIVKGMLRNKPLMQSYYLTSLVSSTLGLINIADTLEASCSRKVKENLGEQRKRRYSEQLLSELNERDLCERLDSKRGI